MNQNDTYVPSFTTEPLNKNQLDTLTAKYAAQGKKTLLLCLVVGILYLATCLFLAFRDGDMLSFMVTYYLPVLIVFSLYFAVKISGYAEEREKLQEIGTEPKACERAALWIQLNPSIRAYMNKIAAHNRLPTKSEYLFLRDWMETESGNLLKQSMNS